MSGEPVISTFSAEHVTRITGLTLRQLSYWDGIGFFKPSLTSTMEGARPMRVYSFRDVVGLRIIAVLKRDHRVSVQQLQKVAGELSSYAQALWSTLKLTVCKGEVSIIDPKTGRGRGVLTGQFVMVPIINEVRHVRSAAAELSRRNADQIGTVERRRNVAHNANVFAGTRVPVRAVERFLDAGYSIPAILREYPSLRREDIEAAQRERDTQAAA